MKPRACAHCQSQFQPLRMGQNVCSPVCAGRFVKVKKAQGKRELRARKEAIKTIPKLIAEAQVAFNAYIRARDAGQPCICCGQPLGVDAVGGGFDCGHYRSTGSASHLRFDERNAHAQRKHCNRYGAGRAVDYRVGLVRRIGLDAVEALEASNTPHKWTRDEVRGIRDHYREKLRELKKRAASTGQSSE